MAKHEKTATRATDREMILGIRKNMAQEITQLEEKRDTLKTQMAIGFDIETFRQINILNYRIEVATCRMNGEWTKNRYLEFYEIAAKH